MTLDEARALREAAGQPTEWPEGIRPPLSRLVLTRIVGTQCEEAKLLATRWYGALLDPALGGDPDYVHDAIEAAVESVGELLQLSLAISQLPSQFGTLVSWIEEEFLSQWHTLTQVNVTDEQLLDMLGRALNKTLTGDEAIAALIPEAQLAGFWEKLPEPWASLWPAVTMKTVWWPLSERTWGAVGVFSVLAYLLWKNVEVSVGSRLVLSTIALWLCWTFIVEQPVRPVWPKALVTVRDVAHAMLAELREQLAHWEMLERDWGENRFLIS